MERTAPQDSSFTRYWLGETATVLAYQSLTGAIGWQIHDLAGSALDLGLVGLAHFSAQILFSLSAGHLSDRHHRWRIATICQLIQAIVATTLAIGSYQGWVNAIMIYISAFTFGAATTFQSPALGGVLYIAGGTVVYTISAVVFVLAGLVINSIRRLPVARFHEPVTLRFMLGGIHYIRTRPVILGAITLES